MFADLRGGIVPSVIVILATAVPSFVASPAGAQDPDIVFNQVTVTGAEASLRLELEGGREVSVAFGEERILVDGQEVGRYAPGDQLERSWRGLLGQAIAAENSELRGLLLAWDPPTASSAEARAGTEAVRDRLAAALTDPVGPIPALERPALQADEGPQRLLELLVAAPDRLRELTAAVQNLQVDNLRIHAGETVAIAEGERTSGSVLILDGDLTLDGTVEGDLVALGGRVELGNEARVAGDLRWSGTRIEGNRGAVAGRISEIAPVPAQPEAELRDQIRRQALEAAERAVSQAPSQPRVRSSSSFPGGLLRGIAGLFQTLLTFAILLGGGLILLYFFPRNLEVVVRTARNATGRSALVGLAGIVLAFPAWIVGIMVLAVSIIGIPVLILWIPGFPLALAVAMALGYLAVARNLGRWASGREFQGLEGFDTSRPAVQIGGGLMILLAPFALAYLFQMAGPWFGIFRGLLVVSGVALTTLVACVGLGAVLLSRGGKDSAFAGKGWQWGGDPDPWAPESDPFAGEPDAGVGATAGAHHAGTGPGTGQDDPDSGPGSPDENTERGDV